MHIEIIARDCEEIIEVYYLVMDLIILLGFLAIIAIGKSLQEDREIRKRKRDDEVADIVPVLTPTTFVVADKVNTFPSLEILEISFKISLYAYFATTTNFDKKYPSPLRIPR